MPTVYKSILMIDDDYINNHLNSHIIKRYFQPHTIDLLSFTDPQAGFAYIADGNPGLAGATILFLDINMPELTGWDILDKMKHLSAAKLQHITTYILSSSIDPADIKRANANPLVKGFISKPLASYMPALFGETIKAIQKSMVAAV